MTFLIVYNSMTSKEGQSPFIVPDRNSVKTADSKYLQSDSDYFLTLQWMLSCLAHGCQEAEQRPTGQPNVLTQRKTDTTD